MPDGDLIALAAVAVLVAVHLGGARLTALDGIPRSRWLSVAAGVSVAYVFVRLLPELNAAQQEIAEATGETLTYIEDHVYLLALAGLAVFYGVEYASRLSRERRGGGEDECTGTGVFWFSIGAFGLYNGLIGYLIVTRESEDLTRLALFTLAIGLHFLVNDRSLRDHHKDAYHRLGRFVVTGAILAGWAVGVWVDVSEPAVAALLAFLAGGIVLNVIKEELPRERQSRFTPFALSAAAYAALLLAV